MTRRATLFAHGKCSPAEGVHPIQPLLRGAVFPATPRANACLGPAFGSAKQRPPGRQPLGFRTRPKGAPRRPDGRGARRPAARERDGREHAGNVPGAGPWRPGRGIARDCKRPGRGTSEAPRPVTLQWAVREYQCEDSYSAMIAAGMRPRSLTLWPRCLAQARISELRSRPGPLRARRRRPPAALARRACSV